MAPPSILVIGAGELGYEVLQALARHSSRSGTKIAVLMRSSTIDSNDESKKATMADLKALDIDIIEGDVINDTEEQLATKFGQYHTVVGCSGMGYPPGTQVKLANAALASGCQRYFPWQFGLDYDTLGKDSAQDLFTEQLNVRGLLREQSTMDWVIVSTGIFIPFIFEPAFGIVNAERSVVTALGSWDNTLTATTPKDIGRVVAEIALAHPDVEGVVFTAGDTISMSRIVDVVEKVRGAKVERKLKTVDQLKQELAGDPENGMAKYRVVFAQGVGKS